MRTFIKLNQTNASDGSKRLAYVEPDDIKRWFEIEQNGKVHTNVVLQDGQNIVVTDRAETIITLVNGQKPTETKQNTSNAKK